MRNLNDFKERLKSYEIDGDTAELWRVVNSDARIMTSLNDVISVLSDNKTNYLRSGYGKTLRQAYEDNRAVDGICRLIHIYSPAGAIWLSDLNNFISSFEDGIICGCTIEETINNGVKLVMIFN